MKRSTLFTLATSLVLISLASTTYAQTKSQVLCYEAKTKRITVLVACPKGTTQLNGGNLATIIGANTPTTPTSPTVGFDLTKIKCTSTSGSASGGTSNSEVGVAVQCKSGIMLARGFTVSDTTDAKPALKSETILKNKEGAPIGTQIVLVSQKRTQFGVTLKVDCCQ